MKGAEEHPAGQAGFFFALMAGPLAFFWERGIVCGMSTTPSPDRDERMEKLAQSTDLHLRDINTRLEKILQLLIIAAVISAIGGLAMYWLAMGHH